MSGSGPSLRSFHGVWQSLHPPTVTRYLPRSTGEAGRAGFGPLAGGDGEARRSEGDE